jgi:hypothetical protein
MSVMVAQWSNIRLNVKGLNPAAVAGTGRNKMPRIFFIKTQMLHSQHFIFIITYKWFQQASVFALARLSSLP